MINKLKKIDIKYYFTEKLLKIIGIISVNINIFLYMGKLKIDKNYNIWGSIRFLIDGEGEIRIGKNFHAVSSRKRSYLTINSPCHLTSIHGGKITIGNNVGLNGNTIAARKLIQIGDETMIAPNVLISDHDGHSLDPEKRWKEKGSSEKIIIGKRCWIGANCIILKGVEIGDNTIIGAGSVVTDKCETNSIYAGNPARKIRNL